MAGRVRPMSASREKGETTATQQSGRATSTRWAPVQISALAVGAAFLLTANFVPVNAADNWLHLVLAIAMLVLGIVLGRRPRSTT
jgi:hypothetical protein